MRNFSYSLLVAEILSPVADRRPYTGGHEISLTILTFKLLTILTFQSLEVLMCQQCFQGKADRRTYTDGQHIAFEMM